VHSKIVASCLRRGAGWCIESWPRAATR
jgi:hypothetical protein